MGFANSKSRLRLSLLSVLPTQGAEIYLKPFLRFEIFQREH